jgi:N-acetylmuramoyl-L-alanine amidase
MAGILAFACLFLSLGIIDLPGSHASAGMPLGASSQSAGYTSATTTAQNPSAPPTAQRSVPAERKLPTIVIDAGHGGADAGARGATGVQEKEITLAFAQALRSEMERNGFRVIMTREGDQNPSFDDRAAGANAQHGVIFVSLHVASTGAPGTVRTYVYPAVESAGATAMDAQLEGDVAAGQGLIEWNRAQQSYVAASRKLGDLLQVEFSQTFPRSPELSTVFPVRVLRSVAAPAVAIEVSSVAVPDSRTLEQMAPGLASSILRGVTAFLPSAETGKS